MTWLKIWIIKMIFASTGLIGACPASGVLGLNPVDRPSFGYKASGFPLIDVSGESYNINRLYVEGNYENRYPPRKVYQFKLPPGEDPLLGEWLFLYWDADPPDGWKISLGGGPVLPAGYVLMASNSAGEPDEGTWDPAPGTLIEKP